MDSAEITGKTVEEAIRKAEDKFGLEREQLKITVLKEPRGGILGMGAGDARISAEPLEDTVQPGNEIEPGNRDIAGLAQTQLEDLLAKLDIEATVERTDLVDEIDEVSEGTPINFNIIGTEDLGVLIGRHGQTLASLQYILRLMVAQQTKEWVSIVLDVDGYKQRRYDSLRQMAERLADQVKARRAPFALEPMPANERRIIHMALADNAFVTTQSTGEGDARKVVIIPKSKINPVR
jgi:spoIIIJ-associated protein